MGTPWPARNTLIVSSVKLFIVPVFDKVCKQMACALWWKFRKKHILFFLQPGCKFVVLREVIITGQLLEFLKEKQYQQNSINKLINQIDEVICSPAWSFGSITHQNFPFYILTPKLLNGCLNACKFRIFADFWNEELLILANSIQWNYNAKFCLKDGATSMQQQKNETLSTFTN